MIIERSEIQVQLLSALLIMLKSYIAFTINPQCPVVADIGHKMQNGVMEAHEFHRLEI